VWDEFFPVRGAVGEVRYRNWRWGANVECFMLDCRRFRSANADPDGPNKTMIGSTQLAWLLDAIARSTAVFKLVLTSVPLDFSTGGDAWSTFLDERNRLLTALVGTTGLIFATADQHWFASHRHAFGIREFQFGPLCRGIGVPPDPQPSGVITRFTQYNVGVLDFDEQTVLVTAIGPSGQRLYAERLTVDALTPR
jgi:phosphodiesterase/alkaline phosphatase D-like protein